MVPMLTHNTDVAITDSEIESYVRFVYWFLKLYQSDAAIEYVELINAPVADVWKGTNQQLVQLQNMTYDMIKNQFPGVMVGTPGFEYFNDEIDDNNPNTKSVDEDAYEKIQFFLNKDNAAKFDFWAFHGYPLSRPECIWNDLDQDNTIDPGEMSSCAAPHQPCDGQHVRRCPGHPGDSQTTRPQRLVRQDYNRHRAHRCVPWAPL
jgi:hypothetical protein